MVQLDWQDRLLTLPDGTQIHALHGRHNRDQDSRDQDCCYQDYCYQDQQLPTLVLLHGALGHIAMWKAFPQRLAEATGLICLSTSVVATAPHHP